MYRTKKIIIYLALGVFLIAGIAATSPQAPPEAVVVGPHHGGTLGSGARRRSDQRRVQPVDADAFARARWRRTLRGLAFRRGGASGAPRALIIRQQTVIRPD